MKINVEKFNKLFLKHFIPTNDRQPKRPKLWNLTNGLCWYWAYVFVQVNGGRYVNIGNHHMMVKKKGRYYDAENPEGLTEIPKTFQCHTIFWHITYRSQDDFYQNKEILKTYDKVVSRIIKAVT